MKIIKDQKETVVEIHFCCTNISRKILPTRHNEEVPIVIGPFGVRAKGFSLYYCPYCGEKIGIENIAGILPDIYCQDSENNEDLEEETDL